MIDCDICRNNRLEHIRNMRWEFGSVLPADLKYNLCEEEVTELYVYIYTFVQ